MRNQLENFTAGEFLGSPALIYFDEVDGKGYLASATDTAHPAQAIVLVDCDADETGQAYFDGVVDYAFGEVSQATPLYLSDTAGEITSTAPANVQRVGFVIDSGTAFFSFSGFSGGGASDALGAGFTSGGGIGTIPDGTKVQLEGYTSAFEIRYTSSSPPDPGNSAIVVDSDGGVVRLYDNSGTEMQLNGGFYIYAPGGADGLGFDANGQVSRSGVVKFMKYDASDYTSDIIADDRALPSVKAVKQLAIEGLNKMTSTAKESLTPSEGWEVYDTDLDGKCVYDGTKWLRLSQKSAPTIAVGAGAGSGATVTVSGNDIEGLITLTGGTSATASATFFTLTFFDSFTTAPIAVMISESNQNALLMPVGRKPGFDAVSTTTFTMVNAAANGIINGTVYKYTYRVIQ